MAIKGLIFDLDGTLLDTINDIRNAVNILLSRHGHKKISKKDFYPLIGNGQKTLLSMALNEEISEDELDRISVEYSKIYEDNLIINTRPFEDIHQMLEIFQNDGIKMSVLSNKKENMVKTLIKAFFPDIKFCQVKGNDDKMPLKPDPTAALYICEKMHLSADDVAFVGDSYQDALTANNGNMTSFSVLWGYQTKKKICSRSVPDHFFKQPLQIPELIKKEK